MKSHTTERFRKAFHSLPDHVQRQARSSYHDFLRDPAHPGLHFKQVHPSQQIYSVRIGIGYRALGVREADDIVWFWIGSHAEYDRLIANL